MSSNTPNYGFILPAVNSATDQDLWGGELNSNWSSIDGLLETATNFIKRAVTGTDTATTADRNTILLSDATSASYVQTLPLPATAADGFTIIIKKIDSSANTVTVNGNGGDIDGASTFILVNQYDYLAVICDGTNWNIISQSAPKTAIAQINKIYVTSTSTYTPSAKLLSAFIQMVGGGGGSGGIGSVTLASSGGGGSGEYAEGTFSAATIGASQTVTIGAAGTAGSSSGTNGGDGGNTSFGALMTAGGGGGSIGITTPNTTSAPASPGASGTGGDFHSSPAVGGFGFYLSGQFAFGGEPSQSQLGSTYGGGAEGVGALNSGSIAGRVGHAGVVIITEYVSA